MRFTAEISCFESRYDNCSNNEVEGKNITIPQQRHFESEDIVANITIQRPGQKRSFSVPPGWFNK